MKKVTTSSNMAFTLMELLVVIMIIGIILGISIPTVVNLQKSQNTKKFNYFTTIVGEAADLYIEKYGKSFDEAENCFDIPYDSLVEEELIQESDITCLSTEGQKGIVQATRVPGTNNFTYQYYLTCTDRTTGEIFRQSETIPTGCQGINGNFNVNVDSAVKVVDGMTSDYTFDTWTRGKVIVTLSSVNPYFYDIDYYEYSLDGKNYKRMANNQMTFEISMNNKVYFRATDINGNVSSEKIASIKIDNDKPTATINISGTMGSNNWYTSNVTASCSNQNDGIGSGIASCNVTPESINNSTTGTQITLTIKDNAGNVNTITQTIKIDKDLPTMTQAILTTADGRTYSSGTMTAQDVKIQIAGSDSPSGIQKYIYTTDNWTTTRDVPSNWIINTTSNANYQVKAIDNAGNRSSNSVNFTIIINKIFTITFNANGGNVNLINKNVTYNQTYGTLPTPTRTGYSFAGWFTSPTGGTQITSNTKVTTTTNQTLYAHWNINQYTLYFNGNGGSSPGSRILNYGQSYGDLPSSSRPGYTFNGWFTDPNGGYQITANNTMGTNNVTVYAHWTRTLQKGSFHIVTDYRMNGVDVTERWDTGHQIVSIQVEKIMVRTNDTAGQWVIPDPSDPVLVDTTFSGRFIIVEVTGTYDGAGAAWGTYYYYE